MVVATRTSPCRDWTTTTTQNQMSPFSSSDDVDDIPMLPSVVSQEDEDVNNSSDGTSTSSSSRSPDEKLQQHPVEEEPSLLPSRTSRTAAVPSSPLRRSPRRRRSSYLDAPAVKMMTPNTTTGTASSSSRGGGVGLLPLPPPSSSRKRNGLLPPLAPPPPPTTMTPSKVQVASPASSTTPLKIDIPSVQKKNHHHHPRRPPPPSTTPALEEPISDIGMDMDMNVLVDVTNRAAATDLITPTNNTNTNTNKMNQNAAFFSSSAFLKPLIGKTPLKEDGTPLEQRQPKPIYMDYDHEDDNNAGGGGDDDHEDNDDDDARGVGVVDHVGNEQENELLPGVVAAVPPTSPLAAATTTNAAVDIPKSSPKTSGASTTSTRTIRSPFARPTRRCLDDPPNQQQKHQQQQHQEEEEEARTVTKSTTTTTSTTNIITVITLDQLQKRMELLFPQLLLLAEDPTNASMMNCVAPRLFACYSLYHDAVLSNNKRNDTTKPSPRKRPRRQATHGKEVLVPLESILPTLSALVDLELALLQEPKIASATASTTTSTQQYRCSGRKRMVHFSAFDGSALQPPSDVLEDSHAHIHSAMEGLKRVIESVELLLKKQQDSATTTTTSIGTSATTTTTAPRKLLQELVDYLQGPNFLLLDHHIDDGRDGAASAGAGHHAIICAQSLSTRSMEFPQPRVQKAALRYASDLQQLVNDSSCTGNLSWHCRLADTAAQLVRYWLRTELNPVPDRAPCTKYSNGWNNRVCDLVTLQVDKESSSFNTSVATAVDDGSLSSLVSNAASHICHYFGINNNGYDTDDGCCWQAWKSHVDATPNDFFGSSELAQKGIAPSSSNSPGGSSSNSSNKNHRRRKSGPVLREWTPADWHQVAHQVEVATGFLAAVNGAKFLYELLTIVVQFPEFQRSWEKTIQASAQALTLVADSLQEQDVHLLLLRFSPTTLLQQLPVLIHWPRKQACEDFLRHVPRFFLFGSNNNANRNNNNNNNNATTRRKRAYQPHVGWLEHSFEMAISKVAFPSVLLAEHDEDEEEESTTTNNTE